MVEGGLVEGDQDEPRFEWDHLGRLPLDTKLDVMLLQNGMISDSQFLDQRLTPIVGRLDKQHEVIEGRVGSIVLTRVDNEKEGSADVFVTKLEIKKGKDGLFLVPEKRFPGPGSTKGLSPKELHRVLSRDNGVFFVTDRR